MMIDTDWLLLLAKNDLSMRCLRVNDNPPKQEVLLNALGSNVLQGDHIKVSVDSSKASCNKKLACRLDRFVFWFWSLEVSTVPWGALFRLRTSSGGRDGLNTWRDWFHAFDGSGGLEMPRAYRCTEIPWFDVLTDPLPSINHQTEGSNTGYVSKSISWYVSGRI